MPIVDVRWRPSGGRGEYEHVPADVLLERNVLLDPIIIDGGLIRTDVWGRVRDGKPRLRRENPSNRSVLNLPQLVAALALLPESIREDHGGAVFPLKRRGYVISSITFEAKHEGADAVICVPLRMQILHDSGEIDLATRLKRVGDLLRSELIPPAITPVAASFLGLVDQGSCSSLLREYADILLEWIDKDSEAVAFLDAPSEVIEERQAATILGSPTFEVMGADETKRKLRAHYIIDRSRRIRVAKIEQFKAKYSGVYCENCSFDFGKRYGSRGDGFIEVHHVVPLAALLPNSVTYLADLLLLCSNCHRMVHRRRPDLTPSELKAITL